jgi:hypothetical protein
MKVTELKAVCRQRGFLVTGTKAQLITRLTEEIVVPKQSKKYLSKENVYDADTDVDDIKTVCKRQNRGRFVSESDDETDVKLVKCVDKTEQVSMSDTDDAKPKKRLTKKPTKTAPTKTAPTKTAPTKTANKPLPKVIEKIVASTDELEVETDSFGNKIHRETGFVFNNDDEVYGTIACDGHIVALTRDNVALCKRMSLLYILPDNMSTDQED